MSALWKEAWQGGRSEWGRGRGDGGMVAEKDARARPHHAFGVPVGSIQMTSTFNFGARALSGVSSDKSGVLFGITIIER